MQIQRGIKYFKVLKGSKYIRKFCSGGSNISKKLKYIIQWSKYFDILIWIGKLKMGVYFLWSVYERWNGDSFTPLVSSSSGAWEKLLQ